MYRGFDRPAGSEWWTTAEWAQWLLTQDRLYVPVRSGQQRVCDTCWGPTKKMTDDAHYPRCYNCRTWGHVAGLVPISYSWERGLESAVFHAKEGQRWLSDPLAAVLQQFLTLHLPCIEGRYGQIDIITVIPSHESSREGWDHMNYLINREASWPRPERWNLGLLRKVRPAGADEKRGVADASLFEVEQPPWMIMGERVLLIDDTWTSGGTINSAAAALVKAGAKQPVAVTIGRQFKRGDPNFLEFRESLMIGGPEHLDRCALDE